MRWTRRAGLVAAVALSAFVAPGSAQPPTCARSGSR